MQKKGVVPLLALGTEDLAHDEFIELVSMEGRVDLGGGFKGGEITLAQRAFADKEEGAVFWGELVVDGPAGAFEQKVTV